MEPPRAPRCSCRRNRLEPVVLVGAPAGAPARAWRRAYRAPSESTVVDAITDFCEAHSVHLCVLASVELTRGFGEQGGTRRIALGSTAQAVARRASAHALVLKNF